MRQNRVPRVMSIHSRSLSTNVRVADLDLRMYVKTRYLLAGEEIINAESCARRRFNIKTPDYNITLNQSLTIHESVTSPPY